MPSMQFRNTGVDVKIVSVPLEMTQLMWQNVKPLSIGPGISQRKRGVRTMNTVIGAFLCSKWELESGVRTVTDLTRGNKRRQHLDIMLHQGEIGLLGNVNPNERIMMQAVNCDGGCGKSELLSTPEQTRDIKTVKLDIILDSRSSMPGGNDSHEADLCGECRTLLLNRYFRIKEGRILEIPRFLAAG